MTRHLKRLWWHLRILWAENHAISYDTPENWQKVNRLKRKRADAIRREIA